MRGMMILTERTCLAFRLVTVGLFLLLAGSPSYAQDDADSPPAASAPDDDAAEEAEEPEAPSEVTEELSEESYLDAEQEDFTPSEEIPTDQSIPFPTDI